MKLKDLPTSQKKRLRYFKSYKFNVKQSFFIKVFVSHRIMIIVSLYIDI